MSGTDIEAKERAQWKAWGFPAAPVYRGGIYNGQAAKLDRIARKADGDILLVKNGWGKHIAEVAGELLNREIRCARIAGGDREEIVFAVHARLTVPERFALEILTRYFDSHYPGMAAGGGKVVVPDALAAHVTPFDIPTEEDAHEAAGVLEDIFHLDAEVTPTDEGFAVVLDDPDGDLADYGGVRLHGACEVLAKYSVRRREKECAFVNDAEDAWQAGVIGRVNQQKRIEAALADIAAKLDAIGMGAAKAPAQAKAVAGKKRSA